MGYRFSSGALVRRTKTEVAELELQVEEGRAEAKIAQQGLEEAKTAAGQDSQLPQETAKKPAKIVDEWALPEADALSAWFAIKAGSPNKSSCFTKKSYDDVWSCYAPKCGCKERYREHVKQTYARDNEGGSYVIVNEPTQWIKQSAIGNDWAIFTRQAPAYVITVRFVKSCLTEEKDMRAPRYH